MKRVALLGVLLTLVAVTAASASSSPELHGEGLTLSLPAGWHSLVGGAGVQTADFPLGSRVGSSAGLARVRRGHVHLVVFNYGPWVPYLPQYHRAKPPLVLRKRDLLPGGMEGFAGNDTFARRDAVLGGDMIEVLADLGPKPHIASALSKANRVLSTLRVLPPRVLRPHNGRLAADGVALRLLGGWLGRIEIPAQRYAARVVLRAARAGAHLTLLELTGASVGTHLDLPVVLTTRDILHGTSPPLARRVFSTGGRSFDLSVKLPSADDLSEANRLLATLRVAPRPWAFRRCNLSLRVPGTWRVALRPRGGCYPVLKLRGPGVLVVLTELRSGQPSSGRIVNRNRRRFQVTVSPPSARARANAVLSTLRTQRRP